MKSVFILTCALALLTVTARAEQEDRGKKKRNQGQNHPAQQVQTQGVKSGKGTHHNMNAGQFNTGQAQKGSQHAQRHLSRTQTATAAGAQANVTGKAKIKHFNISNSPNPKIETVKFRENNRIVEAENWKGERYNAFRTYRAVWHDRGWWRAHHTRIILIGGGWYFWNAGFWYPAWGYDPVHVYYPYDGPIYAYNNLPPDQVIANVQEALQSQGYYTGEVDGLLGPLTRAALADYQRDHGLYTTAAIDEPTMQSLGFA